MNYEEVLDFKAFSKEIRIFSIREIERENNVKCPEVMEIKVDKNYPMRLFFKANHLDEESDSITLKRSKGSLSGIQLNT